MTDIVEQLRCLGNTTMPELVCGAANEIERLRARVAELEKSAIDGYEDGWHKLRNERDDLLERIAYRTMERDHCRTSFDYAIRHLAAIHAFMKPDKVELPDGRVFEFSNPDIEREMLTGLCASIREIPSVLEKASHLNY